MTPPFAQLDRRRHHPKRYTSERAGPDGYFIPPQRLAGLTERLQGTPVGLALAGAVAGARGAKEG